MFHKMKVSHVYFTWKSSINKDGCLSGEYHTYMSFLTNIPEIDARGVTRDTCFGTLVNSDKENLTADAYLRLLSRTSVWCLTSLTAALRSRAEVYVFMILAYILTVDLNYW